MLNKFYKYEDQNIFIAALLLAITSTATISAQNYRTGVGARVGFFNGLTVKHFVNPNNAIEGILNFRWGGPLLLDYMSGKIQSQCPGFDYYLGVGAHIGFLINTNGIIAPQLLWCRCGSC